MNQFKKLYKCLIKKYILSPSYITSRSRRDVLEISAVKSCSVRCEYCPQDELIVANQKNSSADLSIDTFKRCLANLRGAKPSIHWTGYSEACLNRHFPELVNMAHEYGLEQEISTTLVGHKRCIEFLAITDLFPIISLHLPDDKGMMEKGSLKVDQHYLEKLERFLDSRIYSASKSNIKTITFGDKYHPEIEKILSNAKYSKLIVGQKRLSSLHSRAGAVSKEKFKTFNLTIGVKALANSVNAIRKFWHNVNLPLYYCSYERINHPVLIGSGLLNICCMDYGLKCIKGDLSKSSLSSIENSWKRNHLYKFTFGKLSPCVNCEHYKRLTLQQYVQHFNK